MEIARGNIKNDFFDTYLSVKFELMRYLKSRRLLIVGALAVIVPLIFYVKTPNSAGVFAALVLDTMGVFIAISAAMFTGDAVNGEFEKKTNLLSFPTPQRRFSIFLGKYIAALLATYFVVLLYYVTMTLQTAQLYGWGEIPTALGKSFLIALLSATATVSVVFFFSSILKRSIASTIVGLLFIMWVLEAARLILTLMNQEPWFIGTYSADLIRDVLGVSTSLTAAPQELFQEQFQEQFGVTLTLFKPDFGVGIAVLIVSAMVFLVISMAIAVRKEA